MFHHWIVESGACLRQRGHGTQAHRFHVQESPGTFDFFAQITYPDDRDRARMFGRYKGCCRILVMPSRSRNLTTFAHRAYHSSMLWLRYITPVFLCLTLVLPLHAVSQCSCSRVAAPTCNHCVASPTGRCCCGLKFDQSKSCCSDTETPVSKCPCSCSVDHSSTALPSHGPIPDLTLAVSSYPIELASFSPALAILLHTNDRPPISHNRRQAQLCVWLK